MLPAVFLNHTEITESKYEEFSDKNLFQRESEKPNQRKFTKQRGSKEIFFSKASYIQINSNNDKKIKDSSLGYTNLQKTQKRIKNRIFISMDYNIEEKKSPEPNRKINEKTSKSTDKNPFRNLFSAQCVNDDEKVNN